MLHQTHKKKRSHFYVYSGNSASMKGFPNMSKTLCEVMEH